MDESTFRTRLQCEGYQKIGVVEWEPGKVSDSHMHEFDAYGMLLEGRLTVTTAAATMACRPGETFTVPANTPHTETVGPDGARVLIGRRA